MKKYSYISLILFFLLVTNSLFPQSYYWKNINGPFGGRLSSVITYQQNIYCAGNGGVFGSSDSGENWECIGLRDQNISKITISSGFIFAISGNACFRSRLNDTSWTRIKQGGWESLTAKDSVVFVGGEFYGLYRSTDLGENWEKVDSAMDNNAIVQIMITSNNIVLASARGGAGSGVFRSEDMGDSWIRINPDPSAWNFEGIAEYDNILYAFDYDNNARVYLSTDWGVTWSTPYGSTSPTSFIPLSIYADNSGIYLGFYDQGFFRSVNNGLDWVELNTGLKNKNILSIIGNKDFLFAATYDGLYRFEKANYTWIKKSDGINNLWVSKLAEINNKLIIGTYGSGLYIEDAAGLKNINLGPDFMFILDVLVEDEAIYVTAYNSYPDDYYAKLFVSYNYGNSWSQIYTGRDLTGLHYIAKNNKYVYVGGSFGLY